MKRSLSAAAAAFVLIAACASAQAETTAERALRVLDKAMDTAKDQVFEYDVVTWEPGKGERTMNMNVKIKPPRCRFIEYTSPADIKGMRVLILSLGEMYIYLPAFHKVRRVAGHVRAQSFQGTALSNDDMAITQYSDAFNATKLLAEDPRSWKVELTRKPKNDFVYSRIEMTILKKERMPSGIAYFNDKGVKVKSEERTDYSCKNTAKGPVCNCKVMKLIDHTRNGLYTKLTIRRWEVDTGIPDAACTQRALQRGG
jgi:outer membrane lipoprotein-sorting protein